LKEISIHTITNIIEKTKVELERKRIIYLNEINTHDTLLWKGEHASIANIREISIEKGLEFYDIIVRPGNSNTIKLYIQTSNSYSEDEINIKIKDDFYEIYIDSLYKELNETKQSFQKTKGYHFDKMAYADFGDIRYHIDHFNYYYRLT
jgi:hypothetical protein